VRTGVKSRRAGLPEERLPDRVPMGWSWVPSGSMRKPTRCPYGCIVTGISRGVSAESS